MGLARSSVMMDDPTLESCREAHAYVSARVVQERKRLGRNQSELARALDIGLTTANKIENGERLLTVERVCQLALALGVDPGSLLPELKDLPDMLGMGGIQTMTKSETPRGDDYLEAVAAGARSYMKKHGARPRVDGGDASEHVGFSTTWIAIDCALRRGNNGVPPLGGLHGFLDSKGIGKRRRRA